MLGTASDSERTSSAACIVPVTPAPRPSTRINDPITLNEAAALFGVTMRTLRHWIRMGKLRASGSRGLLRCSRAEVESLRSDVPTDLADLQSASLTDLARLREELQPYRDAALRQVERPRVNLGSGPPGRAD